MPSSASDLSAAQYGYGCVVAVTQASINATLKAFVASLQEPVISICYVADSSGDPVLMDFDKFQALARGTDPFTVPNGADPNGTDVQNLIKARFLAGFRAQIGVPTVGNPSNLPDVVMLTSDPSTVQYNMLCSEFTIVELSFGGFSPTSFRSISQPSDKPWYMQSTVNLNLSPVDSSRYGSLPPSVQAQIKNMSDSAFGVQQLLFDLNNARLASPPQIENVVPGTPVYLLLEQYFTGAYFTEMHKSGQPLLGCSIVPQGAAAGTMTITDLNLMISPFVDTTTGKAQADPSLLQQSLSTLNYLCATDNATLNPPVPFVWNWLEPADLSDHDGVLAINRNCLRDYFNQSLQNYIPNVCFNIDAHCDADGLSSDMSVDFTPGGQASLSEISGDTVLSYSYSNGSSDEAGVDGDLGSLDVSTTYNMQIQFQNIDGSACVIVTQHLVINCNMKRNFTRMQSNIVDKTIIDTYTLAVDDNGVLGATLSSEDIDHGATPTASGFSDFFTQSNDMASEIRQQAEALTSSNLQDIPLSIMQNYVFPGGQTFAFKDVQFSDNQDLIASITYVDPTTPPPTVPS